MTIKSMYVLPVCLFVGACAMGPGGINVGDVGAKAPRSAEVLFDGSREMLDDKWTYWEGPRFGSELPIKWKIVDDPVDDGTVVMSDE